VWFERKQLLAPPTPFGFGFTDTALYQATYLQAIQRGIDRPDRWCPPGAPLDCVSNCYPVRIVLNVEQREQDQDFKLAESSTDKAS